MPKQHKHEALSGWRQMARGQTISLSGHDLVPTAISIASLVIVGGDLFFGLALVHHDEPSLRGVFAAPTDEKDEQRTKTAKKHLEQVVPLLRSSSPRRLCSCCK